ncbi:hypothetical protein D3C84_646320 [compost metagenome]
MSVSAEICAAVEPCAVGVEYLQWVPGKRHFRCEKLCGIWSTADCSSRYMRAMVGDERVSACRFCPIGAVHAGKVDPNQAATPSAKVKITGRPDNGSRCTRCGRFNLRIIHSGAEICVSCWNRQREWRLGRNSKGKAPITFLPLQVRRVGIMLNGVPCYQMIADTQNEVEPLAKCIRFAHDSVAFHDEQPGLTVWNEQTRSFEYRDRANPGKVMLELNQDGVTRYASVAVDSLSPGDVTAVVRMPTLRLSVYAAADWLGMGEEGDGAEITNEWRPQAIVCSSCSISLVQARRFAGHIECRCPACKSSSTVH